jgi:hypothetical protein
MSNIIDQDIFCRTLSSTPLDPTLFPIGSARLLNRNRDILPFLCNLLQYATDENLDPVIVEPPVFDISPYTDFTGLTGVGDPRVSLGETMSATFINFLPRMITQTEVMQAGGTQVIDNIICTADGMPIRESQTVPILLSLDLTGKKSYKYGALTVPPISSTFEQLMKPINPQEITDFTSEYVKNARAHHADQFINFINTYFTNKSPTWQTSLVAFKYPPLFMVKLDKYTDTTFKTLSGSVYIKYYYDVKDYIGCNLGINSIQTYISSTGINTNAMVMAIGMEIPDYDYLMNNFNEAQAWYEHLSNTSFSSLLQDYTNIFSDFNKASAYVASHISTTTPIISSIDVNCSY